jgi:hypothetical protein
MKYVVIPEPVTLINKITGKPIVYDPSHPQKGEPAIFTMHRWLCDNVLAAQEIGKGIEGIRRVRKLDMAFENSKPGDLVGVEDADYAAAWKIIENMSLANALVASQLFSFYEAWEVAAKQDEEWKRTQALKAV